MRQRLLLCISLLTLLVSTACAQKSIYVPQEWRNRTDTLIWAESDPDNEYTWSLSRSLESDNVIILWDKGYGSTAPNELASNNDYYVDLDDLLAKCEAFYQLECSQLGFVDPSTSNIAKYKVMVLMNHTTTWTCYGGGYDFQVPALWLNPSTCHPVGSAVAHEVGHSFHYMCYAEASNHGVTSGVETGFHTALGNGQCIWETTANWQALQSYPSEIFTMSGTGNYFAMTHNYAFSHEWHRYQAYMFLVYLCEYYGDIKTVANVWNQYMGKASDFNEALMANKGLSVAELYKLHFDFALHCATYDMEACAPYRDGYVGNFDYRCVMTGDSTYQVAFSSCPQSTGFNVIPLQAPAAGTEVTTDFTALRTGSKLATGDPAEYINGSGVLASSGRTNYLASTSPTSRGFRLGYVYLMEDGTRQYVAADSVYCPGAAAKTVQVSTTVPEGVKNMWLVVSPTPSKYFQHKWDEAITGDDQWPYSVHFSGTDLGSRAKVYAAPVIDGRALGDITLTYDVTLPASQNYETVNVAVEGMAAKKLGTAFQLTLEEIGSKLTGYASSGPKAGKIMFYAAKSDGTLYSSYATANGYGHWYNANGEPTAYGNSPVVFSELREYGTTMKFYIGPYTTTATGKSYTIAQAMRYKSADGQEAKAVFVFRVKIGSPASYSLASIEYDEEKAVAIDGVKADALTSPRQAAGIYDLTGRRLADEPAHGLFIKDGQKVYRK